MKVHECAVHSLPSDLSPVVDAYEHALLARYPAPRYMPGRAAPFWKFLIAAPEWIGDALVNAIMPELKPSNV